MVNDGSVGPDFTLVPPGQGFVAVSRNPFQALAYVDTIPTGSVAQYQMYGVNPVTSQGAVVGYRLSDRCGVFHSPNTNLPTGEYTTYPLDFAHYVSIGDYDLHGPVYYTANLGGRRATYFGSNYRTEEQDYTTTVINATINPVREELARLIIKRWDGSSWGTAYTDTFDPFVRSDLPGTGYFTFDVELPNTYPPNEVVEFTFNFEVTGQAFAIRTIPYLADNPDADRIRVSGASLLVSAVAPELTKGGSIAIAQVPQMSCIDYLDYHCDEMYDVLAKINVRECFIGNAKDGCYGYLRPAGLHDFEMVETFVETENGIRLARNNAVGFSWLVAAWVVPKYDNYYTGCHFRLIAAHAFEFMSVSQWRELSTPTLSPEVWEEALTFLSSMPQFSENPKHLAMLRSMFNSVLRGVRSHSSTVASILGLFFPQAAPLLHAGAEVASGLANLAL
jgi:hypothetical protein